MDVSTPALIISLVTLALSFRGDMRAAKKDALADLKDRVEKLEDEVTDCHRKRDDLQQQNYELMFRILRGKDGQ